MRTDNHSSANPIMVHSRIIDWRKPEYLRKLLDNEWIDWENEFSNANPVDLEIGIGNGSFLIPYAASHPGRNIIGIEIDGSYLKKADKRCVRQNLYNVRLLIGDAKLLVWKLIPDRTLSGLYIHFPDPWFKKRHKKRRLINPLTINLFARKINDYLTITTDDGEYKDWVKECIENTSCFQPVYPSFWIHDPEDHFETKYERKWKAQGKTIYYMKFKKISHPNLDGDVYRHTQNLDYPMKKLKEKFNILKEDDSINNISGGNLCV